MRLSLLCIATLMIVASLAAQQNPSTNPVPRFSSHSELVLVPVIVKDHDKFIGGLKQGQFTVADNGKPRRLSVFEEGAAQNSGEVRDKPGELGNHVAGPTNRPILIILLDLINTRFKYRETARQQILKFLTDNIDANQPTTLLVLNLGGLTQIHSFTTDTHILIDAMKGAKFDGTSRGIGNDAPTSLNSGAGLFSGTSASPGSHLSETDIETVAATQARLTSALSLNDPLREPSALRKQVAIAQTLETLRAFEQIAHAYAGVPGRKALVWVSDGFRFNLEEDPETAEGKTDRRALVARPNAHGAPAYNEDLNTYSFFHWNEWGGGGGRFDSAWRLLIGANIALYSLDPSGLETSFDRKPATFYHTLQIFASTTGGRDCLNRNDLANCLHNAANDAQSYYMLGFYVPAEDRKPGWHRISLKVNTPHSDLRYRTGYFIGKEQPGNDDPEKGSLGVALKSPLDYTGVPMDIRVTGIGGEGEKRKVGFALTLPPHAFFIDEENSNQMKIELLASATDEKSKPAAQWTKTLAASLKPETLAKFQAEGFRYEDTLELAPGKYQLKWVVRDDLTGRMGSVTSVVEVK